MIGGMTQFFIAGAALGFSFQNDASMLLDPVCDQIENLGRELQADSESCREVGRRRPSLEVEAIAGIEDTPDPDVAEVPTKEVTEDVPTGVCPAGLGLIVALPRHRRAGRLRLSQPF